MADRPLATFRSNWNRLSKVVVTRLGVARLERCFAICERGKPRRMKSMAGISVTALSVAALIGTSGCTKTSDGSIVMKKPSFGRVLGFRAFPSLGGFMGFGGDEEPARIVPSQTLAPEPASP